MPPLRVGFASIGDAGDPNYLSGYPYSMAAALERAGCEVVRLFPLQEAPGAGLLTDLGRAVALAHRKLGKSYEYNREMVYQRFMAKALETRLGGRPVDVLFTQTNACISTLKTDIPIYTSTDQPQPAQYEGYMAPPSAWARRVAYRQSRAAIAAAQAIFVPSQWARDRFGHYFPGSEAKIEVIPWGANLLAPPSRASVEAALAKRLEQDRLSLLFVGKDWARKGVDLVLETARRIAQSGIKLRLTVVGVTLKEPIEGVEVENIPYLDRGNPAGEKRYVDLLNAAHFLFVPSKFEAYGQVFCEAAAFGAPPVSRLSGGVGEIIKDGRNGVILAADATADAFADRLTALFADRERYARLAMEARDDFEARLNWDAFAQGVIARMRHDLMVVRALTPALTRHAATFAKPITSV